MGGGRAALSRVRPPVADDANPGELEVGLDCPLPDTLEDGSAIEVELARIATAGLPGPAEVVAPQPSEGPVVAICMATYEPEFDMFSRQIDSIRAQTHRN